jgi:hypothetical protein
VRAFWYNKDSNNKYLGFNDAHPNMTFNGEQMRECAKYSTVDLFSVYNSAETSEEVKAFLKPRYNDEYTSSGALNPKGKFYSYYAINWQ